jgi:hypothetical protein
VPADAPFSVLAANPGVLDIAAGGKTLIVAPDVLMIVTERPIGTIPAIG